MINKPYRILLPVTKNIATIPVLELASSLIDTHGGEVVALGVVKVPRERPYSYGTLRAYRSRRLIKRLTNAEQARGITIRSVVKVGREITPEVVKVADQQDCDLIVLGWDMVRDKRYLGDNLARLVKEADRNIAVIKPGQMRGRHNVLVPMRAGVHSTLALDIAGSICSRFDAKMTVLHISDGAQESHGLPLEDSAVDLAGTENHREPPEMISISSDDIAATILDKGEDFDFIIMGGSIGSPDGQGLGDITKLVARKSNSTVIIVMSRQPDPVPIFEPYRLEELGDLADTAEKLPDFVDKWFAENTFESQEFEPVEELVELKREQGLTISLGLPTLNEGETIGAIIDIMKRALMEEHALLDEIVVIDSGSTDRTVEIAEAAGLPVYQHADILPEQGTYGGKGEALWKSLYVMSGDIIVWIDTDIKNISPQFVYGVIGPILKHPHIQYVKGFYHRPLKVDGGILKTGGGRVTELTARPLINLFFPALSGLVQPLSGEYAGRRSLLEQLAFYSGYGVEMGLLIDILHKFGLPVIGQVDLKQRIHRNQSLEALSKMSFAIIHATMESLQSSHKVRLLQKINRRMNLINRDADSFHLQSEEVFDYKRLPILSVPEYRAKFNSKAKI